jgi:hypothetical protein
VGEAIEIPYHWRLRSYQRPFWDAMHKVRRGVAVWHRRAGKDAVCLNFTVKQAIKRVGVYWHLLPTLRQGRRVVWEGIGGDGRPMIDAWPEELVVKRRNDEMSLLLANGSRWQVVGSDSYDALVGANPVGVVFSEFSLSDPRSWDFVRPILAENDGWAMFAFTPRGRNHGYRMYRMAQDNPEWFAQVLTVDDTGAVTREAIAAEQAAGMPEELVQQEFWCSWTAALVGAVFGPQMDAMVTDRRLGAFPHDKSYPVETWWDLGRHDSMAIMFVQRVGHQMQVVDYIEDSGHGVDHYARLLKERGEAEGYSYSRHVWPHDGNVRELMTAGDRSRAEVFEDWMGRPVDVVARPKVLQEAIDAGRRLLPRLCIDEGRCDRLIDALRSYRREEDEAKSDGASPFFRERPLHDWASHGASALMTGALYTPSTAYRREDLRPEFVPNIV